jgi:two-component system OmpR family response regulator
MRVLIVEDEVKMAALLRKGLKQEGIAADHAAKGEDALWMAGSTEYDAIVLDLMLPGIDGFEVCRRLRDDGVWSPILMLTARDGVRDRVAGLDAGADDYLSSRSPMRSCLPGCEHWPGGGTPSGRPSCA